jgi:hypothetical protein
MDLENRIARLELRTNRLLGARKGTEPPGALGDRRLLCFECSRTQISASTTSASGRISQSAAGAPLLRNTVEAPTASPSLLKRMTVATSIMLRRIRDR